MRLVPVESSMVLAVGYDKALREMEVVFSSGAVWRYQNVPHRVYRELLASDSKGSYMNACIIGVYPEYRLRRR